MNKDNLKILLRERASELVYSYERFGNGSTEYFVYPYERGREIEGAPMFYRFNEQGDPR